MFSASQPQFRSTQLDLGSSWGHSTFDQSLSWLTSFVYNRTAFSNRLSTHFYVPILRYAYRCISFNSHYAHYASRG